MKTIYEQYYTDIKTKDKQFDLYAYSCPDKRYLKIDNVITDLGEDFRTPEQYKTYLDCGFNILFPQMSAVYNDEPWETSDAKLVFDNAQKAGIKRIILHDHRIHRLAHIEGGLIGEGKEFASEKALDDFIRYCIKNYKDHPLFYGLQLWDETNYRCFKSIGQVKESVDRVRPGTFIQCNLLPMVVLTATDSMYPPNGSMVDRYRKYLERFVDETHLGYVLYDGYPFQAHNPTGIYRLYIRAMQIAAKVCKEKNVPFYFVAQSTGWYNNGHEEYRKPTAEEMLWQANLILGFGIKQLAYYTYWSKSENVTSWEYYYDGSAIMTRRGEKTPLYDTVKQMNEMMQKFAPVILNFDYLADSFYIKAPMKTHPFYLEIADWDRTENILSCETDFEVAHVSELYDKSRGQYMVKIQNLTDPSFQKIYELQKQHTKIKFKKPYTKLDVFENGKWITVQIQNGEYETDLFAGEAQFILPYENI